MLHTKSLTKLKLISKKIKGSYITPNVIADRKFNFFGVLNRNKKSTLVPN